MNPSKKHDIARKIAGKGTVRTAGKIEFIRDTGPVRRDIRADGYEWSPDSLRNLAKILWAAQRSHSYAVSALRLFSKMPSSSFSPDGLLGGRGYIQSVKDLRNLVTNATESLSSFTDTLFDEINGEHWNQSATPDSQNLIENAEEVKDNPEEFVEKAFENETEADGYENPGDMNPTPEDMGQMQSEGDDSEEGEESADSGRSQLAASKPYIFKPKSLSGNYDSAIQMAARKSRYASTPVIGDMSSLPAPRVEHIGPGMTENGFVNGADDVPSDDPSLDGFIQTTPIYESGYEDGNTGEDYGTYGIGYKAKQSAEINTYSLLPGANNNKIMPIYSHNLTQEEVDFMNAMSKPKIFGVAEEENRRDTSFLWSK